MIIFPVEVRGGLGVRGIAGVRGAVGLGRALGGRGATGVGGAGGAGLGRTVVGVCGVAFAPCRRVDVPVLSAGEGIIGAVGLGGIIGAIGATLSVSLGLPTGMMGLYSSVPYL